MALDRRWHATRLGSGDHLKYAEIMQSIAYHASSVRADTSGWTRHFEILFVLSAQHPVPTNACGACAALCPVSKTRLRAVGGRARADREGFFVRPRRRLLMMVETGLCQRQRQRQQRVSAKGEQTHSSQPAAAAAAARFPLNGAVAVGAATAAAFAQLDTTNTTHVRTDDVCCIICVPVVAMSSSRETCV